MWILLPQWMMPHQLLLQHSLFSRKGHIVVFRGLNRQLNVMVYFARLGTHYWFALEAGGKVSKHQLTQVDRVLKRFGVQHIAAYSPQARGGSERMFGILQNRLPKELALQNITTVEEANCYLLEAYLPHHNQQFGVPARQEKAAYVSWVGVGLDEVLYLQEERTVRNDNTVQYKHLTLQIPHDDLRHHYVKTTVQVREYLDGTLALFYGHQCLRRYRAGGVLLSRPVETLENPPGFPPFPQDQQPQPKGETYAALA
jgi:hypothetical protein